MCREYIKTDQSKTILQIVFFFLRLVKAVPDLLGGENGQKKKSAKILKSKIQSVCHCCFFALFWIMLIFFTLSVSLRTSDHRCIILSCYVYGCFRELHRTSELCMVRPLLFPSL